MWGCCCCICACCCFCFSANAAFTVAAIEFDTGVIDAASIFAIAATFAAMANAALADLESPILLFLSVKSRLFHLPFLMLSDVSSLTTLNRSLGPCATISSEEERHALTR